MALIKTGNKGPVNKGITWTEQENAAIVKFKLYENGKLTCKK